MPLPKIILIHGLNNRPEGFWPLRDSLIAHGYEVHLVRLPGHGEDRSETASWEKASQVFDENLKKLTDSPYAVIAFSQGALYFQLWLKTSKAPKPICQFLLSPALFVRNFDKLKHLVRALPGKMIIPSPMPKPLRRYPYLFVSEYRNLFSGVKKFSETPFEFIVPTMVIVDPQDEVVDAQKLKQEFGEHVTYLERPYLRGKRPGKYHIIFHPDYFEDQGWERFIQKITSFINSF